MNSANINKKEAILYASQTADMAALPQTVYYDAESGDWMFTNSLSNKLYGRKIFATLLPTRYFS